MVLPEKKAVEITAAFLFQITLSALSGSDAETEKLFHDCNLVLRFPCYNIRIESKDRRTELQ